MKALRLNTITSEGVRVDDTKIMFYPVDPATRQRYLNDAGQPCVWIALRPISRQRYAALVKQCTERRMIAGAPKELTDFDLVRDECVAWAITDWGGFVGADDKPLPCIDAAKRELDVVLKNDVQDYALRSEPVEVPAESFR